MERGERGKGGEQEREPHTPPQRAPPPYPESPTPLPRVPHPPPYTPQVPLSPATSHGTRCVGMDPVTTLTILVPPSRSPFPPSHFLSPLPHTHHFRSPLPTLTIYSRPSPPSHHPLTPRRFSRFSPPPTPPSLPALLSPPLTPLPGGVGDRRLSLCIHIYVSCPLSPGGRRQTSLSLSAYIYTYISCPLSRPGVCVTSLCTVPCVFVCGGGGADRARGPNGQIWRRDWAGGLLRLVPHILPPAGEHHLSKASGGRGAR